MRSLFGGIVILAVVPTFMGKFATLSATAQPIRERPPIDRYTPPPRFDRDPAFERDPLPSINELPPPLERSCRRICYPKDADDCRRRGLSANCEGVECHDHCD
jgi:hypothetical protein